MQTPTYTDARAALDLAIAGFEARLALVADPDDARALHAAGKVAWTRQGKDPGFGVDFAPLVGIGPDSRSKVSHAVKIRPVTTKYGT